MTSVKVQYDAAGHSLAAYVKFRDAPAAVTEELIAGVLFADRDAGMNIVGLEIIGPVAVEQAFPAPAADDNQEV